VTQSVELDFSLLPKRGPEPLEYIPLGKKRCHSDEGTEQHPKRVKQSENSSSESSDGFTYMGKTVQHLWTRDEAVTHFHTEVLVSGLFARLEYNF